MISATILRDRAEMLKRSREFFDERGVIEVDTPLLSPTACVDLNIDLLKVNGKGYLHSSPEYAMKRLLTLQMGDIYQLAHVFRDEPCSERHNPEFMMAEWYRVGMSFEKLIEETISFISLFFETGIPKYYTYRKAFMELAGIDYVTASNQELLECIVRHGIIPYETCDKDEILNLILGTIIEPQFKDQNLIVLSHYPASQAALAKSITLNDEQVAYRFEIYFKGIELANGYYELVNAKEQKLRLEEANRKRVENQKDEYLIDYKFIEALEKGMPECSGVAVGFDRLMMLRHKKNHLKDVMPFTWETL